MLTSLPLERILRLILASTALLSAACGSLRYERLFEERLDPGALATVRIAPLDEALTFARAQTPTGVVTIAVQRYAANVVEGVDLGVLLGRPGDDPITLYGTLGYDGLHAAIKRADPNLARRYPVDTLTLPAEFEGHHIAVGTNYPAHASRVGSEGQFLFPKLGTPRPSTRRCRSGRSLSTTRLSSAMFCSNP